MHFDLKTIEKHPAMAGAILIGGGIVVLLLLSSKSTATPSAASASDVYANNVLASNTQLSSQSIAAGVATNQTNVAGQVANNQTSASVSENQTTTLAGLLANLFSTKTAAQSQDLILGQQINASVAENANNNATAVQMNQDTLKAQTGVALTQIGDNYAIAQDQQSTYDKALLWVEQNANVTTDSGEYGIEQAVVASNPASKSGANSAATAISVTGSQAQINASNNAFWSGLVGSITQGALSAAKTLFA